MSQWIRAFSVHQHDVERLHRVWRPTIMCSVRGWREAVLGCLALTVVGCGSSGVAHPSSPRPATHPPSSPHSTVEFEGVSVDLADGWKITKPSCGALADHTVVSGTYAGSCPGSVGTG